jgi:hypothetical protein
MRLNSIFNCTYCVLFVFYPINICPDTRMSYFRSSIFNSVPVQLYKIVFLAYFGESIKMCANIPYILITVNRYMLIGREHSAFLERISKLKFNHVVWFSLCFSFILNIGHIFEYSINEGTLISLKSGNNFYMYVEYPRSTFIFGVFFSVFFTNIFPHRLLSVLHHKHSL